MILILGGGLAGMSTAYHLGDVPHLVIEGEPNAGGLCRSREKDGFVFDYTGHLLHLRDERVKKLVDELTPVEFEEVSRKAEVRMRGATLPFPFQANLYGLPRQLVADCLVDFVESGKSPVPEDPATSFEDWALAVFGRGISDLFMLPYNQKLFRRDPAEMTADWVSWAVPRPSLPELVGGALGLKNEGMGYNPTFRYPTTGGIGVLPQRLAEKVPNIRFGEKVISVDLAARSVTLSGGDEISYDQLVVTTPLPQFLAMACGGSLDLSAEGSRLDWSVVGCVNLGVVRSRIADGAHWIYLPDDDVPFYRVGFPSNFSSGVAPKGTSSLYVEFGLRRNEPFDPAALERAAVKGLEKLGILDPGDRILVRDTIRVDPGYVIFDRARQDVMAKVVPALEQQGVSLIGRYGAWTYSYMERALLDGMEAATRLREVAASSSVRA